MTNNSLNDSLINVSAISVNSNTENIASNVSSIPTFIFLEVPFSTGPFLDILIISLIASLFTTLLTKYLTDQTTIKALRAEMKKKQKAMREMLKKNPQKAQAMQNDLMKSNMEIFKHSFSIKMLAITAIPLLYVFTQIRIGYMHYDYIMNLGFITFGWLGTYLILTIICSIILKKLLDVA